jgi:glucose/arabinose dehydrogenase
MRLVMNTTNSSGANSVRMAKDPRNNQLYYLKINGDIFRVNLQTGNASTSTKLYSAADHGLSGGNVEGFAIGPDGTIYVLNNTTTNGTMTFARISKGVPNLSGLRIWSTLARTEPYPRTQTGVFDHLYNGLIVSPDGQYLYVNAGSRTDHGEEQNNGGVYPGMRDVPLTAKIFRLPTSGSNLVLTNDLTMLRNAGYLFAEGVRNSFDFGFAANGDLFATENGPDRDMAEELNWIRPGLHYGFPWRMGGADNPQQFPTYNPSTDKLLDSRFYAVQNGFYHNDPTFPPPPTNFAEPVINVGPDADSFRDPSDGSVKDSSSLGQPISTFTPHRSPLGLVFDTLGAMAPPFQNHGFMLSWTPGDPAGNSTAGPFKDASADLVDLNLTKLANTNYQTTVTRIISNFSNPIDAEIVGNRIYVIEYSGNQGIWEITFPPSPPAVTLGAPIKNGNGTFSLNVTGAPGLTYQIDSSSNLLNWFSITSLIPSSSPFFVTDPAATNSYKFYRAVQH